MFSGIACAFVGDILLQGHLYVTDNYLAFHSNVFGYVTKVEYPGVRTVFRRRSSNLSKFAVPLSSVRSITKEKTAMIIPNAVGVSTGGGEKYMFTSFLYRDHAYGVMTQAWNKASHRNSIHMVLTVTKIEMIEAHFRSAQRTGWTEATRGKVRRRPPRPLRPRASPRGP